MKANTLMSPRRTGGQRWVRQCSGHVYRLALLLRQQQNAFDPIVIIIELSYHIVYRDNFDLSYRLSTGNSIWHIVTALINFHKILRTITIVMQFHNIIFSTSRWINPQNHVIISLKKDKFAVFQMRKHHFQIFSLLYDNRLLFHGRILIRAP